jgi:hypothetical protein
MIEGMISGKIGPQECFPLASLPMAGDFFARIKKLIDAYNAMAFNCCPWRFLYSRMP